MRSFVLAAIGALALAGCATAGAQQNAPPSQAQQAQQTTSLVASASTPSVMMVRVYTPDLERAARFYTDALGMRASPFGAREIMMMFPHGGTGVVLYRPDADTPPMRSGFVVNVANLDDVLTRVAAAGGVLVRPVFEVPTVHIRGAIISDPDGSMIELIERTGG